MARLHSAADHENLLAIGSLLLLSAIFAAPASANWFRNRSSNTMYDVRSKRVPHGRKTGRKILPVPFAKWLQLPGGFDRAVEFALAYRPFNQKNAHVISGLL
jgi:hypothetical protein